MFSWALKDVQNVLNQKRKCITGIHVFKIYVRIFYYICVYACVCSISQKGMFAEFRGTFTKILEVTTILGCYKFG